MEKSSPPTPKQLADELQEFARRGLGCSLPGRKTERTVQTLSDISRELADDPFEDWPMRIARVVIPEIEKIGLPDRLAIADVLAIDLEQAGKGVIGTGGEVGPLESSGPNEGRYARAAARYKPSIVEKTFRDKRRKPLFEEIGERLIDRLNEKQNTAGGQDEAARSETLPTTKPPTLLIAGVGTALVVVGVAWLAAVALGVIS